MRRKVSDPFYKSPAWVRLRLKVLRRDNWQCVWCHADVRGKGTCRVDHIKPRSEFPALELEPANLRTLCNRCDQHRHAEKVRGGGEFGSQLDGTPRDPNHWWNQ